MSSLRTLVLTLLFLATGLLAALPASAQSGSVSGSLLPEAENEVEIMTDAEGDVESCNFICLGGTGLPPTELDAPVDIVSVRIAETEAAFRITIQHRAYPETAAQVYGASLLYTYSCSLAFLVGGYEDRYFSATMYRSGMEEGAWALQGRFYVWGGDDASDFQNAPLDAALIDDDHFEMVLPKEYLTAGENHRPLRIGDHLGQFNVYCSQSLFPVSMYDYQYTDGRYTVTMAAGTSDLTIEFPTAGQGGVAVVPGETNRVPVVLSNLAGRKLLVNFTAQLVDPSGAPLADWNVKHAPNLEVKSGGDVSATVVVTPPADAPHRSGGLLKIRALSIGGEKAATAERPLMAVVAPTAENNTLHFHNLGFSHSFCMPTCDPLPSVIGSEEAMFVMNVLETDPEYGQEASTGTGAVIDLTQLHVQADAPFPHPVRLDGNETIELALTLRTETPRDVLLYIVVYLDSGEQMAFGTPTVSIGNTFTTHAISLVNQMDGDIPTGSSINIVVYPQEGQQVPLLFVPMPLSPILFSPDASGLTLPIIDIPKSDAVITDGRYLPTITLGNGTDKEEYINPGRTIASDIVLVNEGTANDVVGVTTQFSEPGWTARLHPGNQFELKPGAFAPVCLQIAAPSNAKEGQVVQLDLTATSRSDKEVHTSLPLTLRVTAGVEIDNEHCVDDVDTTSEDFVAPFVEPKESSAATAWVVVIAAVLMLAARRRP